MLRFTPIYDEYGFPVDLVKMPKTFLIKIIASILLFYVFSIIALGQSVGSLPHQSQELSEKDGIPVLIKHLPDWENVRGRTTFAKSVGELTPALGNRSVLDLIDFSAGTEAVTAQYDAGKLLIVEYGTPQGSIDADSLITRSLSESGDTTTAYRRIGNYNVLVFDAPDLTTAGNLIDQVKYEKNIQWLGDNPFRISAERAFVLTTSDIFMSTVLVIVIGIGLSIFGGIISGYIFFSLREYKRSGMPTFTDAGGMTRLNLDGFTPEIVLQERLLKE
ncbi:MAG: hypothetical protein ABIO36_09110 [Pyrinomonadaceae bacterium]